MMNRAAGNKRRRRRAKAYQERKRRQKRLALTWAIGMLLGGLAYTGILEDVVYRIRSMDLTGKEEPDGMGEAVVFDQDQPSKATCLVSPAAIPSFLGEDSVVLNGNIPNFTDYDMSNTEGEKYSDLDQLGRCGPAMAMLSRSMMPEEERGSIGEIRPSGWHTARYPERIEDIYLYNRCHLIAYAMTGQNDNVQNLITGTRYFNTVGMFSYETLVLDYLYHTDGHVLYRVTPYFQGNELVARGVEMEACSVEDHGKSLQFHVFVYNYQPGIEIDYLTGESGIVD